MHTRTWGECYETIKNHHSLPAGSKSLQWWIYRPIISSLLLFVFYVCLSVCLLFFNSLIWAVKLKSSLPSDPSPQVRNRAGSHPVKWFLFPWSACQTHNLESQGLAWDLFHQSGMVTPTGGKTPVCITLGSTSWAYRHPQALQAR